MASEACFVDDVDGLHAVNFGAWELLVSHLESEEVLSSLLELRFGNRVLECLFAELDKAGQGEFLQVLVLNPRLNHLGQFPIAFEMRRIVVDDPELRVRLAGNEQQLRVVHARETSTAQRDVERLLKCDVRVLY